MRQRIYLTVTMNGVKAMTKRLPRLRGGEFAIAVNVEVPDHFFLRTVPVAALTIPESAIIEPTATVGVEEVPQEPGEE